MAMTFNKINKIFLVDFKPVTIFTNTDTKKKLSDLAKIYNDNKYTNVEKTFLSFIK